MIEALAALFASRGAEAYLGEDVTMAEHMLQAAGLAERDGAPEPLVAGALLHDIGHLVEDGETHHDEAGAALLDGVLPPVVAACARLHVAAKRYLCSAEAGYAARLSAESIRTLALQGGPMSVAELVAFRTLPFSAEAVRVRRWDEAAKVPAQPTQAFDHYLPLLHRIAHHG